MPISYSEHSQLTCPGCGATFSADVWLLVDAQEHPEALDALRVGQLNSVTCPACGSNGPAGTPLLYHDAAARAVIFAAAPGSAEHAWHEQARDLHALLVGSIPVEQRRPYLGDVKVAHDLGGVVRLLDRAARRTRPASEATAPAPTPIAPEPVSADEPLLEAVQALLAADNSDEISGLVGRHPLLLRPEADTALAQLADVAAGQGERTIAESLTQARRLLAQLRNAGTLHLPEPASTPAEAPKATPPQAAEIVQAEVAYQALLQADSAEQLAALVAANPYTLEPAFDGLLVEQLDQALDEGDERLAARIAERREALAALRTRPPAPELAEAPTLEEAIEALLIADDDDAIARVINTYPMLLTEVAQQALWQLAAEARAAGDEAMARYAIECRELLRRVQDDLEE